MDIVPCTLCGYWVAAKDLSENFLCISCEKGEGRIVSKQNDKPKTKIETVSPERAKALLQGGFVHSAPRTLRKANVQKFARDMRAGNWPVTHQGLAITSKGEVLDGRTRLHAVIEAGVSVEMRVTYNADPETYRFIDIGTPRNLKDSLSIDGYKNAAKLADTLSFMHKHVTGALYSYYSAGKQTTPTVQEGRELLDAHPAIADSLPISNVQGIKLWYGGGFFPWLHYIVASEGALADTFHSFIDMFGRGLYIHKDRQPAQQLRQYFMRMQKDKQACKRIDSYPYIRATIFLAWNWHVVEAITKNAKRFDAPLKPNVAEPYPKPVTTERDAVEFSRKV